MTNEELNTTKLLRENAKNSIFLATYLLAESQPIVRSYDECDRALLYIYTGAHYKLLEDEQIRTMILNFFIKYGLTDCWRSNRLNEIIMFIRSTDKFITVKMNETNNLICLNNGVFDLETQCLSEFSSKYFIDTQINVDYVAPANAVIGFHSGADNFLDQCPDFKRYIYEVFNNDTVLIENAIRLGGYLLDGTNLANKIFLLNGPGASGKTTLIETYLMFFNKNQISSLSLEALAKNDFDSEVLITSRINIASEQKRTYVNAEQIKILSEGSTITIKRKYKLPLTIRPTCKIIFGCNGLPHFNDTSTGIYRRLLIFPFRNQYKTESEYSLVVSPETKRMFVMDQALLSKIKNEKSQIFNVFVAGLLRLRRAKYQFNWDDKMFKLLDNYKVENDTIAEFLLETYELDETNMENMPAIAVLEEYRIWYDLNVQRGGRVKLRSNEMSRRIKEVFCIDESEAVFIYTDLNGKQHRCYNFNIIKKSSIIQESDIPF